MHCCPKIASCLNVALQRFKNELETFPLTMPFARVCLNYLCLQCGCLLGSSWFTKTFRNKLQSLHIPNLYKSSFKNIDNIPKLYCCILDIDCIQCWFYNPLFKQLRSDKNYINIILIYMWYKWAIYTYYVVLKIYINNNIILIAITKLVWKSSSSPDITFISYITCSKITHLDFEYFYCYDNRWHIIMTTYCEHCTCVKY